MIPLSELITQFAEEVRKTTGDLPLTIKLTNASFGHLTKSKLHASTDGVNLITTGAEIGGVMVTKGGKE